VTFAYDVTFLNSFVPRKPVYRVQMFFLRERLVYETRIYFRQELAGLQMHSM